jgi:hypothetical protein
MTKLVIVLAAVIVVILVIVIIAARSMRAEDPEEFAERPGGRGPSRGGHDDRYERHPARAGQNGRPAGRQGGPGRGFDQRRDPRRGGYDEGLQDGRGYEDDRGFDPGYSERRSAQPTGPQQRSRGNGRSGDGRPPRRPEESKAPARAQQARSRRSGDSSEWDSSEWEKLSDVDYWAELASDKSLKTTAQPAAQARSGPDQDTQALTRSSPSAAAAPRQDPATGLPVRSRPQPAVAELPGPAGFTPAPVPVSGLRDQSRAAASEPRPVRDADPAGLSGPGRSQPAGRPRVDPDDDPLTSPSFPRIPADDSRSYRNGRADTPSRGSRAPAPYPATTTRQFASYSPPAPDYHGNGSRDTDPSYPNGYRHDPLLSRDPYSPPAEPPPPRPATPAAPPTAGNPYGSYVTPDSQATVSGYSDYSGAHSRPADNGNGSYLPSALPGETSGPASNGYWHQQPPTPSSLPAPEAPSYLSGPRQYADPLGAGSHRADYGNGYASGYAPPDPAGYPPGSYPPGPQDPAGYAPLDPYGPDGYGGYPGYGAPGR